MSARNWTPFIAGGEHWTRNAKPVVVRQAVLNTTTAARVPGVYIKHSGAWFVMPDICAIQLANDILDTIETRNQQTAYGQQPQDIALTEQMETT